MSSQIDAGALIPEEMENVDLTNEEVYIKLKAFPGIGPFSAANMLQLLGRYERIACDSETVRHLKEVPIDDLLERRYEKYRKIGAYLDPSAVAERNGQVAS